MKVVKIKDTIYNLESGKNFDRARYIVLKEDVLRSGDGLIIPEYDRLGRADETKYLQYLKKVNPSTIAAVRKENQYHRKTR